MKGRQPSAKRSRPDDAKRDEALHGLLDGDERTHPAGGPDAGAGSLARAAEAPEE